MYLVKMDVIKWKCEEWKWIKRDEREYKIKWFNRDKRE